MQVTPIRNTYNSYRKNSSYSSFKGGLTDCTTKRVFDMLKPTVKKVFVGDSMDFINVAAGELAQKFRTNSFGIMILPQKSLSEFCKDKLFICPTKYSGEYSVGKFSDSEDALEKMCGICVSVGDKPGPVENWTKAYETTVVLLPKIIFKHK